MFRCFCFFSFYFIFGVLFQAVPGRGLDANAKGSGHHGIAMHGTPMLAPDSQLDYVRPDAPKGGVIRYGFFGSFKSLNPFNLKGGAPRGIRDATLGNNVFESLMTRNRSEPFSLYGLLAERIEIADDRRSVTFFLNRSAQFSDGKPVTVADVRHSFELLKTHGRNTFRNAYNRVSKIESLNSHVIKFTLSDLNDRELPLIVGLMPILPKHAMNEEQFQKTILEKVIGSGPYIISNIQAGSSITLTRNPNYWANDLPIKRGLHNFDEIKILYFKDVNGLFEAFRKGLIDVLVESDPARWATAYNFPAAQDGRVITEVINTTVPKGMNAFVFNTRRSIFQNRILREGLGMFIDFAWLNRNWFYDLNKQTGSFFAGSPLSTYQEPASPRELQILNSVGANLETRFVDGSYRLPLSDGSGRDRTLLRRGYKKILAAGYERRDGKLVHSETEDLLQFEILVRTKRHERLALAFQTLLKRIGVEISVRLVDDTQFWERLRSYDFDMIPFRWSASLSPGNEQKFRWSSAAADSSGSFNFAGAKSSVIDALIAEMLKAEDPEDFNAAVKALDRALMAGFYFIPLFHAPDQWVARWAHIHRPKQQSFYGWEPTGWWYEKNPDTR